MNFRRIGLVTIQLMVVLALATIGFFVGIFIAYQLDVMESKLPNIWTTMEETNLPVNGDELEVTDSLYQTPQEFDEQPAYNITKLKQVEL